MSDKILSEQQKKLLTYIANSNIGKNVYWSGGTVLAACYFQHRLSEDIDLFAENIIDNLSLQIFVKNLKKDLNIRKLETRKLMNRQNFVLDNIKMEIIYFPFQSLAKKTLWNGLLVDSLEDICTNKILALYQRNDPKDVFDLYFILKKTPFNLEILIKNIQKKFGETIEKSLLIAKIYKNMENLNLLSPMVFDETVFEKIKKHFVKVDRKYLFSILL